MSFRTVSMMAIATCSILALGKIPASASNALHMVPIQQALASEDAQTKLDHTVHFYFGDASHPPVTRDFGEYVSNKKANAFAKSDDKSCNRAFLSAMIQLQTRAHELGADSVINIHSYFKQHDVSNQDQVECYVGFLMSGVALKGDFVKTDTP